MVREKAEKGKTLTDATAELWRTPCARDEHPSKIDGNNKRTDMQIQLAHQAGAWPTPRGEDSESCGNHPGATDSLTGATKQWPTPNVPNGGRGMSEEAVLKKGVMENGKKHQVDLGAAAQYWPTPSADGSAGEDSPDLTRKGSKLVNAKAGRVLQTNLATEVKHWATPTTADKSTPRKQTDGGRSLMTDAATWPTPTAMDSEDAGKSGEKHGVNLPEATKNWPTPVANPEAPNTSSNQKNGEPSLGAAAENWPTPNSRDHKGSDLSSRHGGASLSHYAETGERTHGSPPSSPQVPVISAHGSELSPTALSTASRRRLNPAFVCWLMGWPWWWTNPAEISYARQATELYLSRLRTLLSSLLGEQD